MADIISNFPIQQIGFGMCLGAASGATFKRWSRDVMYGVGVGFIFLQTLSHYGFISIHWNAIKDKTEKVLDVNGDGKFDADDVKVYLKRLLSFLQKGVPDSVGFTAGFYAGIQYL
jgi:uncharacterized membrane protein (Fun14 family)